MKIPRILAAMIAFSAAIVPSSVSGQTCDGLPPYEALSCRIGVIEVEQHEPVVTAPPVEKTPLRALYGVRATAYHAVAAQTDSDPRHGAAGTLVVPGKSIAVSRELLWRNGGPFRWGDTITLEAPGQREECNRSYTVEDTMGPQWRKRVDILLPTGTPAFSCYNITILYE